MEKFYIERKQLDGSWYRQNGAYNLGTYKTLSSAKAAVTNQSKGWDSKNKLRIIVEEVIE